MASEVKEKELNTIKESSHKKRSKNKKPSKGKRSLLTPILFLVMLLGLAILAYPTFSDYWNSFHQTRAIMSYMEEVSSMDTAVYDEWLRSAREYNQHITDNGPNWMPTEEDTEKYNEELAYNASGNMGYIIIDKLNTMLSLYHGTCEAVLQTGIGHVEGSSLPVGSSSWDSREGKVMDPNEGVHIVLSGHRGLPSAKLFSDLDKLVEGDIFVLNILNETLTFQVDQIRVVEPTDLSTLRIFKGKDYCTLVTCTPYGINTHRLLVRGHRVANAQGDVKVVADALQIRPVYIVPFIGVPVILLLIILMLIDTSLISKQKRRIAELQATIKGEKEN